MNGRIIDNINAVVQPKDTLFHLGDWSFGRCKKTNDAKQYRDRIACRNIVIIPGNHDPHMKNMMPKAEWAAVFEGCFPFYRLKTDVDGDPMDIFMFHYACRVWPKSHYGMWHLFGHSHGSLSIPDYSLSCDVGVDCNDFKPLNLRDIKRKMAKKTFKPIDHHGSYDEWAEKHGH